MNKILFSHSYFLRFDPKQWALGQPYPPLGTLFAAGLMQQHGYETALFDTMFVKSPDEVTSSIKQHMPDIFVLYDDGFNYLTKMCLTNMREAAFRMIQIARAHGCKVIVSSSDATDHFNKYLDAGADFIMLGEAEMSLLELTKVLQEKQDDFSSIAGLAYRQNDETIKTARRNVIKELDTLPMPAWRLINIEPYKRMWLKHNGYFSLNIGTTRGCPYKCNWCAKPIYGNRYNARSPQNVVNELKYLKTEFGYDHIWFCDDIFGLKPGWVNEFAILTEQEGLKFKFKIQSRADLLLQENNIKALAKAGCDNVWIGAESGSQKILDAMDKGITIAQIAQAAKLLKEHNIKPSFFIQFGYPGETMEDIEQTINMINRLLPYSIGISVSYPLPGTKFYENVKNELKEKTNWTDSNELMLMFKNTYSPAFYKQLHRYVQKNYRKHLAIEQLKALLKKQMPIKPGNIKKVMTLAWHIPAVLLEKYKLKAVKSM